MAFASTIFLTWFLPLFLLAHYACRRRGRSTVLALGSCAFYGWWEPVLLGLILASSLLDFCAGLRIAAARERGARGSGWLAFSLCSNLGLLAYFKYANWFIDSLNAALSGLGAEGMPWVDVVLPVGISFYTFQTMSYTIDVWRGAAPPSRRWIDFLSYVTMFPQLVAGPIVRYATIERALTERAGTYWTFAQGVVWFQIGFAKKVLIADNLAPLADAAFAADRLHWTEAWLGLFAYAFQIYFDFSGYSDMAIGLGLMLGFAFPINFRAPYRATSVTDFWRRWHISLSTWLRDYLYIPLGGSRGGALRTHLNLATVMLLGGLWHGANWTFLVWGAWQGGFLILERLLRGQGPPRWPIAVRQALTFLIVCLGWVFFRAATVQEAWQYLQGLMTFSAWAGQESVLPQGQLGFATLAIAALLVWTCPSSQRLAAAPKPWFVVALQLVFLLALVHLHYQAHVPFIYFQF